MKNHYLIIIDADDGRAVRLFSSEQAAIAFVTTEHVRRWDADADDRFQDGQGFERVSLYRLTPDNTELLDTYNVEAEANGDAEGWRDAERNVIAKSIATLATSDKH